MIFASFDYPIPSLPRSGVSSFCVFVSVRVTQFGRARSRLWARPSAHCLACCQRARAGRRLPIQARRVGRSRHSSTEYFKKYQFMFNRPQFRVEYFRACQEKCEKHRLGASIFTPSFASSCPPHCFSAMPLFTNLSNVTIGAQHYSIVTWIRLDADGGTERRNLCAFLSDNGAGTAMGRPLCIVAIKPLNSDLAVGISLFFPPVWPSGSLYALNRSGCMCRASLSFVLQFQYALCVLHWICVFSLPTTTTLTRRASLHRTATPVDALRAGRLVRRGRV
jgi:hypothetical protein